MLINLKRTLASTIVFFVRLVIDGMIRKAFTNLEIFFRSSLGSDKIMSGLGSGIFVHKYFSSLSCVQLNKICSWFCEVGLASAGRLKIHRKTANRMPVRCIFLTTFISYTSILPFFFIFLLTVDQISLASTLSNSNLRPLSFFSFSSLK